MCLCNNKQLYRSLSFDDDAKKGVQLIRENAERRGFRDYHFSTASCFHTTKKEQICCFLTHHPGLLEEDAR